MKIYETTPEVSQMLSNVESKVFNMDKKSVKFLPFFIFFGILYLIFLVILFFCIEDKIRFIIIGASLVELPIMFSILTYFIIISFNSRLKLCYCEFFVVRKLKKDSPTLKTATTIDCIEDEDGLLFRISEYTNPNKIVEGERYACIVAKEEYVSRGTVNETFYNRNYGVDYSIYDTVYKFNKLTGNWDYISDVN